MAVTGPSRCPGCAEPLEPGDNFCGVCGAERSATADGNAAAGDHPTLALSPQGAPGGAYGSSGAGRPDEAYRAAPPPAPAAPAPVPAAEAGPAEAPADPRETFAAPSCVACRTGTIDQDGYCEHCGHAQPRERDHFEQELGRVAAVSDRGHRHHRNEDFFAVAGTTLTDGSPAVLAVVCDGVSSATRPDDASQAAAETAAEALVAALPREPQPQQAMHDAIVAAAKAVDALAASPDGPQEHDPYRRQNAPACTLVAAVAAAGVLTVGWIGDSRVYWIPDDRTAPGARLTEDDSWAAQMVANNLMTEAEAYADERAHAITGWLGADAYELQPHTAAFRPDRPGVVVVCTDGLWNYTEAADELAEILPPDAGERPLHGARTLVHHALDSGGHDNVTVALVPFPVPAGGAGSA
ncbi:protein phosphatase 2C domain-containing protein [Streptomyces sp. NPDC047117]|uniref:protein phosphatase 2C domain-containing protein n=1 Tax=unclassified Streptomyces TaxID=2593676 RepID=UPI0033E261A2